MLNQIVLVGRIKEKELKDDKLYFTLSVPRREKNEQGVYDVDLIDCVTDNKNDSYYNEGELVGVKGELCTSISNNGIKSYIVKVSRVTFLASKKENN